MQFIDYLLKPLDPEALQKCVRKAAGRLHINILQHQVRVLLQQLDGIQNKDRKIVLRDIENTWFVKVSDILFCEAEGIYTRFFLQWGYNESLAASLEISHNESDSEERRYQTVMRRVVGLPGKVLVVIDNLQHEKNTPVESEVRKLLANSELKIIITSREPFDSISSFLLESVDILSARGIFLRNCSKTIDTGRLDELLTLVSCNALLTELMAKTIYNDFGLTIGEVIARLLDSDIEESLQVEVEQYSTGEMRVSSVYNHLLRVVDIEKLEGSYEPYLVYLLSILPSTNLPIEDIFSIFLYTETHKAKVLDAINSLHKKGLLVRSGDFVKMHRLIQDVVRMQLKSYVFFAFILNSLAHSIRRANQAFSKIGYRIVLYAESILEKIRGEKAGGIQQPLLLIKNNMFPMYRYLGQREKANKLGPELITGLVVDAPKDAMSRHFNHSLQHNVATYYFDTGNLTQAENHFKKAIELNGDDHNISVISSYLGLYDVYYKQGRLKDALQCANKTLEVFVKFPENEHDDVWATISNNLALINWEFGDKNEAVRHINIALKLYRDYEGERKNSAMLAAFYANAAMIYSGMVGHEMAIQFALHAIHYRSNLELEDDAELLAYCKIATKICENAGSREDAARLGELIRRVSSTDE